MTPVTPTTSERWELGDAFVLRHAGFPFDWLESLGVGADALARADDALAAEDRLLAIIPEGERAAARGSIARAQVPKAPRRRPGDWAAVVAAWQAAREALIAALAVTMPALRARLHELAGDPGVQEAVFLSSPAMYDNVWSRYLAATERPDNANFRRSERQVYTYLQRLCGKNETTSFFGPVGYGQTVDGGAGVPDFEVRVLLPAERTRRVFISISAVRDLHKAIGADPELALDLPVRKNPIYRISADGIARSAPLGVAVKLPPLILSLAHALADGASLHQAAVTLVRPLDELVKSASPLLKAAIVVRGLPLRTDEFEVFGALRASLDALAPSAARDRWAAGLAELEALRAEFQAGDLGVRRRLLPVLEARFTALTGEPARRGEGQVYADRFVIYEEASSPFRLRLSRPLMARLGDALSDALALSAAYGQKVQREYEKKVAGHLATLGDAPLDFLSYAAKLALTEEVKGSRFSPVPPIMLPAGSARTLAVPSDTLGAATPGGRYALPDVCLSAPSPEAIAAGRFDVLLARVHHHLLPWSWLCGFHGDRPAFDRSTRAWLAEEPDARGLLGMAVRRRNKGFYCYPGRQVASSLSDAIDAGGGSSGFALNNELVDPLDISVTRDGDRPVLKDRAGQELRLYLPLDDFSHYPPFASLAHPLVLHAPIRSEADHMPRITLGGATYQRERWTIRLEHADKMAAAELLIALRRKRREGMPRFVFCRVPSERKPVLIDSECPFAFELLRHLAGEGESVTAEEMLPAPGDLWLKDERGRYTCEWRMLGLRWSEPRRTP